MNILLADSRGGGMLNRLRGTLDHAEVKPGARVKLLTGLVQGAVPSTYRQINPTHVYVMAGINDVTERVESPISSYKYKEVICVEDPHSIAQRVISDLDDCAQEINKYGAIPVFATISKANIAKYNQIQLNENHTTTHLHQNDSYPIMQTNLESSIDIINDHIRHLNRSHEVSTPLCHNVIIRRRGTKNQYKAHDWSALGDGIHGTWKTRNLWAKSLRAAMSLNKGSFEDSTGSPKRSWKFEKRPKPSI